MLVLCAHLVFIYATATAAPTKPLNGMIFSGTPVDVPATADCAIRKAAWAYGKKLQPQKGAFKDLYDALQLQHCAVPIPATNGAGGAVGGNNLGEWAPLSDALPLDQTILYVDPGRENGAAASSASSSGTCFATIEAAVIAARGVPKPVTVALKQGVHFLEGPLLLEPEDSGITFRNVPGERAVVSGGQPLTNLKWKPSAACTGCYEVALAGVTNITNVPGLRLDGVREIRARYPNHDPEQNAVIDGKYLVHDGRQGMINQTAPNIPTAWILKGSGSSSMNGVPGNWPPESNPAATFVIEAKDWPGVHWPMAILSPNGSSNGTIPQHDTWTGEGAWGQFWIGVNGTCADRHPPAGYWCAPKAPRHIAAPDHYAGMVLRESQLTPQRADSPKANGSADSPKASGYGWPYKRVEGGVQYLLDLLDLN
jgi:hypothetical protein